MTRQNAGKPRPSDGNEGKGLADQPGGLTGQGSDTHLPASESEALADKKKSRSPHDRGLTQLPPD